MKEEKNIQTSESLRLGILLAVSGGFMDSYSYLYRGQVFANAQTGNMLLFGVRLAEGDFDDALHYLFPVLAFTAGIIIADLARHHFRSPAQNLHWRQVAVLIEAAVLFGVAFLPQAQNLLANSLTSLVCGIQVESFRKIHGNAVATTMCIGNLRSGTENLCGYILEKDRESLKKVILYYLVIFCFIAGAVTGSLVIDLAASKAILCCSALQIAAFLLMFRKK